MRGLFQRRRRRRLAPLLIVCGGIVSVILLAAGIFSARLAQGPLDIDMLRAPLIAALEDRIGHGYRFDIGETSIDKGDSGPALVLHDVVIRDSAGRPVVAAPKAQVELDLLALVFGSVRPTRFDLVDLDVRFAVLPNGAMAISAGSDRAQPIPLALPEATGSTGAEAAQGPSGPPVHNIGMALGAAIDMVTKAESPLGALVRLGIAHGRLVVDDRTAGQTTTFQGFDLAFDKDASGGARLSIAASGPNGRWSAIAKASTNADGRSLDLELHDLSLAEFMLAAGTRSFPFYTDMPISTKIHLVVGNDGVLQAADGKFGLGAGHLRFDDPDDVPRIIDEIVGSFHFDPATRQIAVGPIQFFAQETHVTLQGSVQTPATADGLWTGALTGSGVFAPQASFDHPLVAETAEIAFRFDPTRRRLDIDRLALKGPEIDASMSVAAAGTDAGPSIRTRIVVDRPMPLRSFAALWPTFIAADLRKWILSHMLSGVIESGTLISDLDAQSLAAAHARQPIPPDALSLDLSLADASIAVIDGAPPLIGVSGSGHVNGRTSKFANMRGEVEASPGHRLLLSNIDFTVPNTTLKPAPANVTARLQGEANVLIDVLKEDALRPFTHLPPDALPIKGEVDSRFSVDFKLGPVVTDQPVVRGSGQISNFSIDKVFGDEKLEGPMLNVSVDGSTVHAKGDAKLFGSPAAFELKRSPSGTGEATITATMDDAARARRGMGFGSALVGPVLAHIVAPLGQEGAPKAQIELDLSHTVIEDAIPGVSKPAGKPAKMSFALYQRPDGYALDQLSFESGATSLRGTGFLDLDGKLTSAKLPQVRISPGDDMRAEVARGPDALKVTVRAGALDARPFLRDLMTTTGPPDPSKDFDLDLKAQTMTGYNQRAMTGVDLKLSRRGPQIRQLQLAARMGRSNIVATLGGPDRTILSLICGDAGSALAFIDLYKHMEAGELAATIRLGTGRQDGTMTIHDFLVRNEPALRGFANEALSDARGGRAINGNGQIRLDPSAVRFTKLQTTFSRSAGLLTLRDSVAWGDEVGASVAGILDYAHDRVSLHGTFVPAYGLNNIFSNIPLFGPLLGGGEHEGLFAVNYRVSGPASKPELSFDPLSAIAPGFVRSIFGAFDGTNPPDDLTSTAQPPATPMDH